ncbi:hypothetical protein [Streptomyces sp. NPDC102360]|uniref:hypothetical protein n=1 Tax=Streptomyces sp. NPDC102360 TaxID=3366160 RepID=UPI0038086CE3
MVINAQGNNEAHSTEPGTALLLAAAPAGKVGLIDAVSVLPTLAAVPPSVLTGTAAASVVELADPLDPQAVLTRLRTAAAQPGPLHLYVAGQLHLDHRQRLLHLALARTAPSTLRYTALPWHWLTGELMLRRPHTTTVVVDLVADAEAWKQVGVSGLGLGHGTSVFGRVLPPPPRRTTLTPTYLRAYADIWRTGARPTPPDLHETAAAHAGPADALFVALGSGHVAANTPGAGQPAPAPASANNHAAADPPKPTPATANSHAAGFPPEPTPAAPPTDREPTETPTAATPTSATTPTPTTPAPAPVPPPASTPIPVPDLNPEQGPDPAPTWGAESVQAPASRSGSGPAAVATPNPVVTSAPAQSSGPGLPPAPAVTGASGTEPAVSLAPGPGAMPDTASPSVSVVAPAAVASQPSVPTSADAAASGSLSAPPPTSTPAPSPGPAVQLAKAPASAPVAAAVSPSPVPAASVTTPTPVPPGPEAAPVVVAPPMPTVAPAAPAAPAAPDPHALLLAAVQAGRHGEAASIAAAWEGEALRVYGMRSSQVVHWMEVRADLARLAEEPGRSCELWIAVAHARIARGESPSDEDVEAAVDRAHHQFEQVRDPDRARGHAAGLTALREQVPGRRPGALDAIRRRLDALNAPTRKA